MATTVKFYKDGKETRRITSIGYLPVDETPVDNSLHLASSGSVAAVKKASDNAFSSDNSDVQILRQDPEGVYVVGKFYSFSGTFNLCTDNSGGTATFQPYSVVEALNYLKALIEE